MNDRDIRRYERLTRVQTFGRLNAADFSAGSKALRHFGNVDGVIDKVDDAKAGQNPSRVSKETLLDALNLDLQNIALTARAIELTTPNFAAPYRIPDNTSESSLLSHATAVLALLEDKPTDSTATQAAKAALRARFLEYEFSPDFVADLRAAFTAVIDANKHNQSEVQEGVENTALIGFLLGEGSKDVMELNAIMHNKYARQPEKLRSWQSASRVERAPQKQKELNVIAVNPASSTSQTKAA